MQQHSSSNHAATVGSTRRVGLPEVSGCVHRSVVVQ